VAVLIDASILIEAERGRLDIEPHVAQRQEEEFFLSVITASELLHGVHRAVRPEVRTKRSAFVEAVLERFPLLPVDLATARAHAQVRAELAAAGLMIGSHDKSEVKMLVRWSSFWCPLGAIVHRKSRSQSKRWLLLLLSVGWLPPSLRPSGAGLARGTRVCGSL
jgi:tRNA(fMet)-specific endonuclease VapC